MLLVERGTVSLIGSLIVRVLWSPLLLNVMIFYRRWFLSMSCADYEAIANARRYSRLAAWVAKDRWLKSNADFIEADRLVANALGQLFVKFKAAVLDAHII